MKNINSKEIETNRLLLKIPTINEQFELWNILKKEEVNRYYFPTPNRIFTKYDLRTDNINDLREARKIFIKQLNDWERQKPFYEKKIIQINAGDNNQKFTWSIYLKDGNIIGQMTVQPSSNFPDNPEVRDVGWFIDPIYQCNGYATEAAIAILKYMFNEVEISDIYTSAAIINSKSWGIMEKLGFERTGEKISTYFDDDGNILKNYCYHGNKQLIFNKISKQKEKSM